MKADVILSNKWISKRFLQMFAFSGTVLFAGCGTQDGGDGIIELKFGHVGAPGSLFALSAEEFSRRVEEKYPGRVQAVSYTHLTLPTKA